MKLPEVEKVLFVSPNGQIKVTADSQVKPDIRFNLIFFPFVLFLSFKKKKKMSGKLTVDYIKFFPYDLTAGQFVSFPIDNLQRLVPRDGFRIT